MNRRRRRSQRSPLVTVVAVAAVAVLVIAVVVWRVGGDDEPAVGALNSTLTRAVPAVAPFAGLTEVQLSIDGECRRVAVADSIPEQSSGLRGISDPGPYAGMLFAYPAPVQHTYTMSGVTFPLELGFYDDRGNPVDRVHLVPCPKADASCPSYPSRAPYRYTLETYGGDVPSGPIGGCPA